MNMSQAAPRPGLTVGRTLVLQRWVRRLLGAIVFALGCAKLAVSHDVTSALPQWVYYAFSGLELTLGAALLVHDSVWPARLLVVFFVAAALFTMLHDGSCG
ncbi:MAG: hypothetical protein KDC87_10510 [Planctomycetes bacterium]|nr:hypothetical protein [Planctomycetota bacterium]